MFNSQRPSTTVHNYQSPKNSENIKTFDSLDIFKLNDKNDGNQQKLKLSPIQEKENKVSKSKRTRPYSALTNLT